ncbi:flagellar assembly protein FlaJ [Bacillus licheniformis]|uniref:flagellar assembly protein FlaJ n=1 Tax=Bacillus TaxID=1386 RepID=UPI000BA58DBF|nr:MULTISPECIES: flagellar assembly protein FlaJ [Bacillus]MBA1163596.1 flagellar assembly protein FlaJ [Bacillus licheniformis]MBS2762905.1 flagellar assembly protein FlaJ [Bacillus licheniformis]MDE1397156.1 flagellar assembly protein FlaJ [Bacillus licheniformis]MDE1449897.1 flagellar assembly protein FlaJ [Bacillus licheniformis]MEC2098608.1 flagellar assembly protein FlaJ [Bacillus paralicheniformis]
MIIEILKEKHLNLYLNYFGKTRKSYEINKWLITFLVFFIYSMIVIFLKQFLIFLALPVVLLAANKFAYINLVARKKKDDLLKTYLFPEFLRCFICLLGVSGNVYSTLKATVPYVKEPLKAELQKLITNIERDNDRRHYIEFANSIGNSEASMVMSMIHEFSEFGIQKDALQQLEQFIERLQENKTNELIERKVREMDKYSVPPVVLSVLFVLSFAVALFVYYMSQIQGSLNF